MGIGAQAARPGSAGPRRRPGPRGPGPRVLPRRRIGRPDCRASHGHVRMERLARRLVLVGAEWLRARGATAEWRVPRPVRRIAETGSRRRGRDRFAALCREGQRPRPGDLRARRTQGSGLPGPRMPAGAGRTVTFDDYAWR